MHGSAPKYAGKNVINPTAVILSAVMMLRYLEMFEQADAIEHAVLVTLESGVLTGDVLGYERGTPTTEYRDTIIGNLGRRSTNWTVREHQPLQLPELDPAPDYVLLDIESGIGSPSDAVAYAQDKFGGEYELLYGDGGYLLARRR